MECERIERDETVESYLSGRLHADERAAFEQHSFACPRCLEKLQVLRALQAELWEQGSRPIAEVPKRRPDLIKRWALASTAALALVMIGAVLWWMLGRLPERRMGREGASAWAALAAFEAPAYLPLTLRSGTAEAAERFLAGMEHYSAGRYNSAIRDLRAAEALRPQASNVLFFLGVSYILNGQTDKGISCLKKAVSLGDPSYSTEARFYLAKGWLRKGEPAKARIELEAVVGSGGRLADEAARLLALMGKIPKP